ncbi:MAG: glycosyltransferase family 2 protein [Bacillota bacterium]
MSQLLLSVIICTYNRGKDILSRCLDSLTMQQLPESYFEVIVVDNNSTDATKEIVSAYLNKFGNWRYVFEGSQGLSYARNRGCKEARGSYLVYIDDDTIVPPEYLTKVRDVIVTYEPDIFGGPIYPYYVTRKPKWFKDSYQIRKYEEYSCFSKTCRVTGCNFIIRKELLENLGMFDVDLGMKGDRIGLGEEAKVLDDYRRKTPPSEQRVYYSLECKVLHLVPDYKMKLSYVLLRQYHVGKMSMKLSPRNVLREVIELPLRIVLYTIKGVRSKDYVETLRNISFQLGIISGAFNLNKNKRRQFH